MDSYVILTLFWVGLFAMDATEAQFNHDFQMSDDPMTYFNSLPAMKVPLLKGDHVEVARKQGDMLQNDAYVDPYAYLFNLPNHLMESYDEDGLPPWTNGGNRVKRKAKVPDTQSVKLRGRSQHYEHPKLIKDRILDPPITTKKPTIQPENMNPGVIFRVRMSDAIWRIKQRMYEEPERHIESDIVYTNLIKKVVADEIVKFNNLLLIYRTDRSVKEHVGECGGRIYKFITYETIKVNIYCVFDALWIDGTPYVIGDDYTVTPLEVPPQLQCDAAECSTITYVDAFGPPHLEE